MDATLVGIDADVVYETPHGKIWVGSWFPCTPDNLSRLKRLGIKSWIRTAMEHPHDFPMDDGVLTLDQLNIARQARDAGIRHMKRGNGDLLVTCAMGANRSAFVAGLIARKLTGHNGLQIFENIRTRRTVRKMPQLKALSNRHFVAYLMRYT